MIENHLHIISLTIPWPPNYGGAIDIWYKLKALNKAGVKITLHCFKYNRPEAPGLKSVCEQVYYYPRSRSIRHFFCKAPFIVASRQSLALLSRLTHDRNPILMEGIHSTRLLNHPLLAGREIWIRTHNVEYLYYQSLLEAEKSWLKKLFFASERYKLKAYESRRLITSGLLTISKTDHAFFKRFNSNCHLISPFHGNKKVTAKPGLGRYVLYHGDLSVGENIWAASALASLSTQFPVQLIIAGRSPSSTIKHRIQKYSNALLVEDPSQATMNELIREAAVILLPANQTTGFRLKLINSLFQGRHVVASQQMVTGTGLEELCNIAQTPEEWVHHVKRLVNIPFTEEMRLERQHALMPFDDDYKARELIKLIFN